MTRFEVATQLILATPIPLSAHPAAVYLSSLSPGSRRTMGKALNVMARLLTDDLSIDALSIDWSQLTYQHAAALRSVLRERYAPATANRMLCALRRTLKEAQRLGWLTADAYAAITQIPNVRGDSPLRGRVLKPSEIEALLAACKQDDSPIGARDAALIAILAGSGLRRSESVALDVADLDPDSGALRVRHGKGGKHRTVYLPSGTIAAVIAWLAIRGGSSGPLICRVRRGGHVERARLCDQAVMAILQKRGKQAGVAPFSPHDFRRTFITNLLEAGVDLLTVSRLAAHSDPATTQKYDLRGEPAKRKAVQLLQIPFSS